MSADSRFNGQLGEEYPLFARACPHFGELQRIIGWHASCLLGRRLENDSPLLVESGCGPGYTTRSVVEHVTYHFPKAGVLAIDNEPKMLVTACENLSYYIERGTVQLIEDDLFIDMRMRGRDHAASVDGVVSGFTLHNAHETNRRAFYQDMYAVLKPGGFFVNGDKYAHDDLEKHKAAYAWQRQQFRNAFGECNSSLMRKWLAHYADDDELGTRMYEGETIRTLQSTGFVNVQRVWRAEPGMEAIIVAQKPS